MLGAKVKRLSLALGAESRHFVHGHSTNWVFGHNFAFRHFTEANARAPKALHSILRFFQFVRGSDWLYPVVSQQLGFKGEADGRIRAEKT